MTDQGYVADKEKKFETRTFTYFGLAFMALGFFLYFQPGLLIGLPVAHAGYAKELELTLMWGKLTFAFGSFILGFLALMWVYDYLDQPFKELFGQSWRKERSGKPIDQD